MNYQHAFHAGNFADVHKHAVLARIVDYLRGKPAPFRVIDSHAGAGRYDLSGPQAARSGEWQRGIKLLVEANRDAKLDAKVTALLAPYLECVAACNAGAGLRYYPGSPLIVQKLLRRSDRLIACEAEPRAAAALKSVMGRDRRVKMLAIDGWMAINAGVPPKERRGLVLIDPPYEERNEFQRLSDGLAEAHAKWSTGIYLVWYPIKDRIEPDALAKRLRGHAIQKMLRCEITLGVPRADEGLIGSGLIAVNPPYTLAEELAVLQPSLARVFSPEAHHRLDWLARER